MSLSKLLIIIAFLVSNVITGYVSHHMGRVSYRDELYTLLLSGQPVQLGKGNVTVNSEELGFDAYAACRKCHESGTPSSSMRPPNQ